MLQETLKMRLTETPLPRIAPTRGEMESEVTQCVLKILKDTLGRGPQDARAFLCDTLIVVRCVFPLQTMEKALLHANEAEGIATIRKWRTNLYETCRNRFVQDIGKIAGVPVLSFFADCSPKYEESILAFSLEHKPVIRTLHDGQEQPEK
jgi:uncharacterized protein YbcI